MRLQPNRSARLLGGLGLIAATAIGADAALKEIEDSFAPGPPVEEGCCAEHVCAEGGSVTDCVAACAEGQVCAKIRWGCFPFPYDKAACVVDPGGLD